LFDHAPVPFGELGEELLAGREALGGRVAEAGVCGHRQLRELLFNINCFSLTFRNKSLAINNKCEV
jgi:hypothetical protein